MYLFSLFSIHCFLSYFLLCVWLSIAHFFLFLSFFLFFLSLLFEFVFVKDCLRSWMNWLRCLFVNVDYCLFLSLLSLLYVASIPSSSYTCSLQIVICPSSLMILSKYSVLKKRGRVCEYSWFQFVRLFKVWHNSILAKEKFLPFFFFFFWFHIVLKLFLFGFFLLNTHSKLPL